MERVRVGLENRGGCWIVGLRPIPFWRIKTAYFWRARPGRALHQFPRPGPEARKACSARKITANFEKSKKYTLILCSGGILSIRRVVLGFLKGFIMMLYVKVSSRRRSDSSMVSHGILPRILPYKFDFYRKIYRISSVSIDFQQIFIVFLIKKLQNRWKLVEIDEIR